MHASKRLQRQLESASRRQLNSLASRSAQASGQSRRARPASLPLRLRIRNHPATMEHNLTFNTNQHCINPQRQTQNRPPFRRRRHSARPLTPPRRAEIPPAVASLLEKNCWLRYNKCSTVSTSWRSKTTCCSPNSTPLPASHIPRPRARSQSRWRTHVYPLRTYCGVR